MIVRFLRTLRLTVILACLPVTALLAASESYVQSITGHLKKGDSLTVVDDKFQNLPLAEWNRLKHLSIEDVISFELRQDTSLNFYTKSFSCTLNVTIKYYTSRDQQSPKEIDNIDLVVRYDTTRGKSYPLVARYRFKDAFKVTVVINSISSPEWKDKLPDVFRLKSQILVERKYPFDEGQNGSLHLGTIGPLLSTDGSVAGGPVAKLVSDGPVAMPAAGGLQVVNGALPISWNPAEFTGAEEFDIEWTFIDALSGTGLSIGNGNPPGGPYTLSASDEEAWMNNNATRVTVTASPYNINLPYEDGFILVRIRKVSYDPVTNVRLTCQWVYKDDQNNSAVVAVSANNDVLNWQYTGNYSEGGQRKEVISYFDGSQRNRQTVTLVNSDQFQTTQGSSPTAVVQETIYDAMGRPSVSMLPAPTLSGSINFYPNFNLNGQNQPYSYADIASNTSGCGITAGPSATTSGASQYYSPSNTFLARSQPGSSDYYFNRYIPDAKNYPFSVTEYMPDNTGRIRRRGKQGQSLQVGSGHETQYRYAKPVPVELLRLFGMEIGDNSHYLKNMVVDPNGQISVNYLNAAGKTIATALAGPPPAGVDALPAAASASFSASGTILDPEDFTIDKDALNMSATGKILVEVPGSISVTPTILNETLITLFGPGGTNQICSSCYYLVTCTVTDECGTVVSTSTYAPWQAASYTCNSVISTSTGQFFTAQTIGEYTVNLKLQMDKDQIDLQTKNYITTNTDLQKLEDFFNTELNNVDLTGCYNTCDACKSLTSVTDFTSRVQTLLLSPSFSPLNSNDPRFTTWINNTYNTLKARCNSLSCVVSPCEQRLTQMKLDVQPGGQYALYDQNGLDEGNPDGIFLEPQINVMQYYNTDPAIASIIFTADDGTTQTVGSLSQADFIHAYMGHPEWADQFVTHHIEYCSYLWCKDASNPAPASNNEVSYLFDANLQYIQSGADAASLYHFTSFNPTSILFYDPWFQSGARGAPYVNQMSADLNNASDALGLTPTDGATKLTVKSLSALVDWILYCKPSDNNVSASAADASWQSCAPNDQCRSLTMEWQLYRNFYLQLKSKYYRLAKIAYNPNCLDCFIGGDPLSTTSCTISGTLADYSIVQRIENSSYNYYVVYKNGTAAFPGNYTFTYDERTNGLNGGQIVVGPVQVYSHTGDMQVLISSFSVPQGQSFNLGGFYELLGFTCSPTAAASCVAGLAASCPPLSEFHLEDRNQSGYTYSADLNCRTYTIDEYLVHNTGPVTGTVSVAVDAVNKVSKPDGGGLISNTDYPITVTIPAGQSEIKVGNYLYAQEAPGADPTKACPTSTWLYTLNTAPSCHLAAAPASNCTSNPNYTFYQYKTRVFNDYSDMPDYASCNSASAAATNLQSSQTQATAATLQAAMDNLGNISTAWLNLLKEVRNEEFSDPLYATALSDAVLQNLASRLQQLSATYLQIASQQGTTLNISSTLPSPLPAGFSAPNGYMSFTDAFTALIGTTLMQKGFGPDLLNNAYPFDKQPVAADMNVNQLTPDIYSNVVANANNFNNASRAVPTSISAYLIPLLGDDYNMTIDQLSDVYIKTSSTCPYPYLANPTILPVAFTVSPAIATIGCTRLTALNTGFAGAYPNVTAGSKLYDVLYTNYLNHQLGYPLSFSDYAAFASQCSVNSAALLADRPMTPTVINDYFGCTAGLLRQAFSRAGQFYDIYITQIRRQFRNTYVSKCLSNQPSVSANITDQEYNYTLFYYDQGGNLIKTVPPEGVHMLGSTQLSAIQQLSTSTTSPSSCPAFPATVVTDQNLVLGNLSIQFSSASTRSIDFWLYNPSSSARQFSILTPDNRYILRMATDGVTIWAQAYSLTANGSGGYTATLESRGASLLPAGMAFSNWTHFGISLFSMTSTARMQIYADGSLCANVPGTVLPPYPLGGDLPATLTVLPSNDISMLRQIRTYASPVGSMFNSNARNQCMGVSGPPPLFWAQLSAPTFCNFNAGQSTAIPGPNKGSLNITFDPDVDGTSTTNLFTDVTNTFTMEFWANPTTTDVVHTSDIFSGVDDLPPYAIFPTYGGTNGMAGVGVAVGTDGITVFEHAASYLPAVLDLRMPIGGWTHIAVVYQNGYPSLYVNGVLQVVSTRTPVKTVSPSYNMGGGAYGTMLGGLDEVRIWGVARTAAQIAANYNHGLDPADNTGLRGYWPMNSYGDNYMHDITCYGNTLHMNTSAEAMVTTGASVTEMQYHDYNVPFIVPNHGLTTNYAYNSLNHVVQQTTPDEGTSNFLFDRLDRLTVSQNAEQLQPVIVDADNPAGRYSYTQYDAEGRIKEAGEKLGAAPLTEAMARDDNALSAWFASGNNRQVTVTAYDIPAAWAPPGLLQNNLRKRVASTALLSAGSDPSQNRVAASYFNYDIEGNVAEQVQENTAMANSEKQFVTGSDGLKHIKYDYDLISDKINRVSYQDGKWDQFYYQYKYDADNRLLAAYSSRNNSADLGAWTKDAGYVYYHHGLLARLELGSSRVQGLDYTYTVQGWPKGLNGQRLTTSLTTPTDISGDGTSASAFSFVGNDVLGYSLGYFNNDYQPIGGGGATAFANAYTPTGGTTTSGQQLFNGNISNVSYAIAPFEYNGISGGVTGFSGYTYRYDQKNRLTAMDHHTINSYSTAAAWDNTSINGDYQERVSYDGDGNILSYVRNGSSLGGRNAQMDNLTYNYNRDANGSLVNNRLRHVTDGVTVSPLPGDPIDVSGQQPDNYVYDSKGSLIRDMSQNQLRINWTVYGRMAGFTKTDNSALTYAYDPLGNRISKTYRAANGSYSTSHYVRDVQGNVLAVYQYKANSDGTLTEADWLEQHLYGGSRLGMLQPHVVIPSGQPQAFGYNSSGDQADQTGNRLYELTNHLGNVMVTINDRLNPVNLPAGTPPGPNVVSSQDYYPFGMLMPGRTFLAGAAQSYRYGYNGKEKNDEIEGAGNQLDYGDRMYDPRLGRWLSIDPIANRYPGYSPYNYAADNPIIFLDEEGDGGKQPLDPTLKARLNSIQSSFVDVLERCNNASLRSFEGYAWDQNPHSMIGTDARDSKYLGLAGESVVQDYLFNLQIGVREIQNHSQRGGKFAPLIRQADPFLYSYTFIGGWDEDKSIDLMYSLNLGDKGGYELGVNMPFANVDGRPFNKKEGGELYNKPVNFVMEIKTGTTVSNFIKGFSQALSKSQDIENGVPVVVMDFGAYKDAIKDNPGFKTLAEAFIQKGGRLMLIDDLNKTATEVRDDAVEEVHRGRSDPRVLPSAKGRPD
jgi:RHS repeat-associated protein